MDPYADLPASRRVRWLARLAFVWAALITARLIYLQVIAHADYREAALGQQRRLREVLTPRGTIFDRNGRPLAMSVPVETVSVNPILLPDRPLAAHMLASILSINEAELSQRLESYAAKRKGYMVVAKRVDAERAGRLRNLGVDWISFEQEGLRRYPNGVLASHVLGGVDHEEHGNAGIEMQFDDELGGYPGYEWVTSDVKKRSFDSAIETAPQESHNLILTIDRRIQFTADAELRRAVIENHCDSGTAVAMNPHTGEILAISNYPYYNPNEPPKSKNDYNARKNLAVGDPFEPGSVFKVFTVAAALETTRIRPETVFHCSNGAYTLFGRTIHEAHGGYGALTVEDILAKSSNIGAVKIAQQMGIKNLHEYLMRFGFNQPTGIELPSESSGLVFRLNKWQPTSIGSVPMGHEVLVTSLQLARACSAIANNGLLVKPRLTLPRATGEQIQLVSYHEEDAKPVRIIKPETAITMRKMMETAVLRGTGKHIHVDGYTFGGKTGTAQMFDKVTKRYTRRYNASFMGFAPLTNPAVVIVVTLNGSTKYGGVIAGPVFKEIAQTAMRAMNIPQDNIDPEKFKDEIAEPTVSDVATETLSTAQAAQIHQEMETEEASTRTEIAVGPKVPNFIGKPIRTVIEEATAQGIRIELTGAGIAREQDPSPGSSLLAGQKVKVRFER